MLRIKEIEYEVSSLQDKIDILLKEKNTLLLDAEVVIPDMFGDIILMDLEHVERHPIEVCFRSMKTKKSICLRVKPPIKISGFISGLTGIYDDDVKDCPDIGLVAAKLSNFLTDLNTEGDEVDHIKPFVFMAHNGRSCDFPIIIPHLKKYISVHSHYWIDSLYDLDPLVFRCVMPESKENKKHSADGDVLILEGMLICNWESTCEYMLKVVSLRKIVNKEIEKMDILKKILHGYGCGGISTAKKADLLKILKGIEPNE